MVDELAHDNPPESRNLKRWQDVRELVSRGITVVSAVNLQHIAEQQDAALQASTAQIETDLKAVIAEQARQAALQKSSARPGQALPGSTSSGRADPAGKTLEKAGEPLMIGGKIGGELYQKDAELAPEQAETVADPVDPFLRLGQPLVVRQRPGRLDGHQEPLGKPFLPGSERSIARPAVIAVIHLDSMEMLMEELEPAGDRQILGIESSLPMLVAPPRCAYVDGHSGRGHARTA